MVFGRGHDPSKTCRTPSSQPETTLILSPVGVYIYFHLGNPRCPILHRNDTPVLLCGTRPSSWLFFSRLFQAVVMCSRTPAGRRRRSLKQACPRSGCTPRSTPGGGGTPPVRRYSRQALSDIFDTKRPKQLKNITRYDIYDVYKVENRTYCMQYWPLWSNLKLTCWEQTVLHEVLTTVVELKSWHVGNKQKTVFNRFVRTSHVAVPSAETVDTQFLQAAFVHDKNI